MAQAKPRTESEVIINQISDTEVEVRAWLNGGSGVNLGTVHIDEVYGLGSEEVYKDFFLKRIDPGNVLTDEEKEAKFNETWDSFSDAIKADAINDSSRWLFVERVQNKIDSGIADLLSKVL